jgi:hypothetical protein
MKVLLQDKLSRRYYAGPQRWVDSRAEALDFGKIEMAAKAYTEESTHFAEIVIDDGELPQAESRKPGRADTKRAGSHRARPVR